MSGLHSDIVGTELHVPFHYIQNADPGAVGAGKFWLDTTTAPFPLWRRNAGDTGWDAIGGSGSSAFSGCQAYRSTNQTMSDATPAAIIFDATAFDTDAYVDIPGNPTRMTVPTGKGGYFTIGAEVQWADNVTGLREIRFLKNNTDDLGRISAAPGSTNFEQNLNVPFPLVDGDYIEVFVTQNSGGNLDIVSNGFHSIIAWLTRMGS